MAGFNRSHGRGPSRGNWYGGPRQKQDPLLSRDEVKAAIFNIWGCDVSDERADQIRTGRIAGLPPPEAYVPPEPPDKKKP